MNARVAFHDTFFSDHGPMCSEPPESADQGQRTARVARFWEENQPTVLIAAPDPERPAGLIAFCAGHGIRTHLVQTGAAALIAYGRNRPDAVVLDETLPAPTPALDVAAAISADGPTPVFVVGHDPIEEEPHARAASGIHSYPQVVASPVLAELTARSQNPWPSDEELSYGPLVMRPAAFEVLDDGEIVALTLREFELLRVLMLAAGQAVTTEQLKSEVWGALDESVRTETVKVHMNRLRKKLTRSVQPSAVRGVGYVLKIR